TAADASANVEELDVEHERRVRRDGPSRAAGAVAEVGRNDQRSRTADLHPGHALIPAANDFAGAELERKGLVAIAGAVEFLSVAIRCLRVVEPARVMHGHALAGRGGGA